MSFERFAYGPYWTAIASEPDLASEARVLYREAHELLLIFGSMRHK